jgi:hypothetical protein
MNQKNDNFIDKTFTVLADILLKVLPATKDEKQALIDKLKLYLEETSREKIMERKSLEVDYKQKELQQVPFLIYIG